MPMIPLDSPEPFAATLGIMLYPGVHEDDRRKAQALAAQWIAEPLRRFHKAGRQLPYFALARIAENSGALLTDLEDRWWGGTAVGELFKTFYILAKNAPTLASWEHAIKIYKVCAKRARSSGSRTDLWRELVRFRSAAHLWGAWSIREGKFSAHPEVGYDEWVDFQSFLTETEILRDFGQSWCPPRAKSSPPLPTDVWRVSPSWQPPARQVGWPNTGMVPDLKLPGDLMGELKSPGRPRKAG